MLEKYGADEFNKCIKGKLDQFHIKEKMNYNTVEIDKLINDWISFQYKMQDKYSRRTR